MSAPLRSEDDQRSARNLLAWASRIMLGAYGSPRTKDFQNAAESWQMNYKAFRSRLPDLEPIGAPSLQPTRTPNESEEQRDA